VEEEARTPPYWNDEAHPPLRHLHPILLRTQKKRRLKASSAGVHS